MCDMVIRALPTAVLVGRQPRSSFYSQLVQFETLARALNNGTFSYLHPTPSYLKTASVVVIVW